MVIAAATVSLSGPLSLQGRQAAHGLEVWAAEDHIELHLVDDASNPAIAVDTYRGWLSGRVELLLGPYGSGLVRHVAPLVTGHDVLLWNHGGSADDLARRLVVPVSAPASTYFRGAVALAHRRGLPRVVLAHGKGPFARAVVAEARQQAADLGLAIRQVPLDEWSRVGSVTEAAVLVVGTFADDVAVVEQIRASPRQPRLLGCVAAGLPEFGRRLGSSADGVVGPVQWIPETTTPEVGPAGDDLALRYEATFEERPSYVAAQAAAAGFLAAAAHRHGLQPDDIPRWRTTTLLGAFALNERWQQVGHSAVTIEWRQGRQERPT